MPQVEREAFLAALLNMKNTIANPLDPPANHISIYDQFVLIHNAADARISLSGATAVDPAHQGSAFGPWHREFLLRFELELQKFDPNVMLPYWDWTDGPGNANIIFDEFGMGPDGDPGDSNQIKLGYFASEKPGTGANTTPLPPWYPLTMNGWQCDPRLVTGPAFNILRRNLDPFTNLAAQSHVRDTLNTPVAPAATDALTYMAFRLQLEAGTRMHNAMHNWFGVGSHMRNPNQSPNDPMFFLHHCNCDRIWAMWQMDGHEGNSFYQVSGGFQGHNLAEPMWPWVGGLGGYTSTYVTGSLVIPDFSAEVPRTAADVIDHRNIVLNGTSVGYVYDTQVVAGIALDRTGSMTGPTPDPLTGMAPNISKWDAAKLGVSHFLQDAEAAYLAAESYVTTGVNTFRSTLGVNEVTAVSGAVPPFGLVKAGSPYAQAAFNADVAGLTPSGGTPLAAALSETEDEMVRPPYGDNPAEEQRYLCILTDGIETSPPLLSTLGTPEFPNTIVFGLGFGIGGGWNGVDYATITNMVSKGKAAPAGVQQTFHGENANVINKFFTNSIAHTLGFEPVMDPKFEIFPGELVMCPFQVGCTDQVMMITVQGFDFEDKHWNFYLLGPDSEMYFNAADAPYLITTVRRDARLTLFLNRNYGPLKGWEGTWNVMVTYKREAGGKYMYMPNHPEMLINAGVPPLLGPRYTRYNLPPEKRRPLRLTQPEQGMHHPYYRAFDTGTPSTVSVNVYARGQLSATLVSHAGSPFAGSPIELVAKLNVNFREKCRGIRVTGRMVAPDYSIGNILLDFETIPRQKREKYYRKEDDEGSFDMLAFLADYEKAKPGAFKMRDEVFELQPYNDGTWRALIRHTRYPGVYRFGVLVEGALTHADGCTESIYRVLNSEVALGIKPDGDKTKPCVEWASPGILVVRFKPVDKLGNPAMPLSPAVVQVLYQRQPLEIEKFRYQDGVVELEILARGNKEKAEKSHGCIKGPLKLKLACGGIVKVAKKQSLNLVLKVGATALMVAHCKAKD